MAHKSMFTYNLTRPYPFKWFTPVIFVSAIILTALLSWLNYASNGFDMVVTTSSNPNVTRADSPVLKGLPSLLTGNYKPVCQPASLTPGTRFYTNHEGLQYEVRDVGQRTISQTRFNRTLPALIYNNNVLENCSIKAVEFDIESQDTSALQLIRSPYGIIVRTSAICNVTTSDGVVSVNLQSEFNNNPPTPQNNFYRPKPDSKASLWWGESIMETYWVWLAHDMGAQRTCSGDEDVCEGFISKAYFIFNRPNNSTVEDILDPQFLKMESYMVYQRPNSSLGVYYAKGPPFYASEYAREGKYPSSWWAPAEKLAKSAWSTVLVDLGQNKSSNILLDDAKLKNFTSDFDQLDQHSLAVKHGPGTEPYDPASNLTGPLSTGPATINTAYICNVPRRKSAGVLVWLILLADVVFLQLAWKIFKMIVDWWVERKDRESQFCEGCLLEKRELDSASNKSHRNSTNKREPDNASVENHGGSDVSSTMIGTDSQSERLSRRTRSLLVAPRIRRTKSMG